MKKIIFTFILLCTTVHLNAKEYIVSNTSQLEATALQLAAGDIVIMRDGIYMDVKLVIAGSGVESDSIVVRAQNPGKVYFSGDAKVELRGNYIVFRGVYFRNGNRHPKQWRSHGAGLVAIYGSHNRVSNCLFHHFDIADSAYITTSLDMDGKVPQYCRIDHCAFIEKTTFDQVINLNNTPRKSVDAEPGIPMYHRIDHCYFSNPPKKGNAGGGIRIGYWREDYGRCLVDNNLFERQDSEAEIITSKSKENVYYNNTFLNCRGTLNFRHGDRQVAINNFFIGTDMLFQYGGMYVWGSGHLIACNYFSLPTTLRSRGSAALYFNMGTVGSEHALAFDITIARNLFQSNNGYDINLSPMLDARKKAFGKELKQPYGLSFTGNIFGNSLYDDSKYTVFYDLFDTYSRQHFADNYYNTKELGLVMSHKGITRQEWKDEISLSQFNELTAHVQVETPMKSIEGIHLNFNVLIGEGITHQSLTRKDVGPYWCTTLPGVYFEKGE